MLQRVSVRLGGSVFVYKSLLKMAAPLWNGTVREERAVVRFFFRRR